MLNIISKSIVSTQNRGPRKVVVNLMRGLDELGVPYVVNAALDATDILWIHDDPVALMAAAALPPHVAIIAGPNVFTTPAEFPAIDRRRFLWLHPAPWVAAFWQAFGGADIPCATWPVGIDTTAFAPAASAKDTVLLYNKQRAGDDVERVVKALQARGQAYEVITYGQYHEAQYQALLARSRAIIWLGRSESQGYCPARSPGYGCPGVGL
jgi:hypothetical protein